MHDIERVVNAIGFEAQNLSSLARDYAVWDETYQYARGANPGYIEANLGETVYDNLNLGLFAVYDARGRALIAVCDERDQPSVPCEDYPDGFTISRWRTTDDSGDNGIIAVVGKTILCAFTPIVRSDGSGTPAGVLLMGRTIDGNFVSELRERTGVVVEVLPGTYSGGVPLEGGVARVRVGIHPDSAGSIIRGVVQFFDPSGRPVIQLGTKSPRILLRQSQYFVRSIVVLFALIMLLYVGALTYAFHNWITLPLSSIESALDSFESQVSEINSGETGDKLFSPPETLYRKTDEIGKIADMIRQMHEKTREAHLEVMKAKEGLEKLISRRNETLASVNTKLEMFKKVLENTSEAVIITDLDGNIMDMNDAMCLMSGYAREELLGQNPRIFHSGRHDVGFYRTMWDGLIKNGHWEGELWDRKKDGALFPKWQTINTIYDDRGLPSNYIGVSTDISVIKEAEDKLNHLAYFDPLTGLPNRMLFADRLEHEISCAKRSKGLFALLFIDLDRFKNVNDTMGHPTGDELLVKVSQRLTSLIRESDTLSRIGGDEFTIILKDIAREENAGTIASSIVQKMAMRFEIGTTDIYIGASVGIALYPKDANDAETMIRKADAAMYLAKDAGKGMYRYASGEMEIANQGKIEIDSKMHKALERNEFLLYYQPQNSVGEATPAMPTGLVGAEALIRWRPEPDVLISPGDFLPVAEETGFIAPLGDWVLLQACKDAKSWLDMGKGVQISVNVSARQFESGSLVDMVTSVLQTTGLPPRFLKLEVTESGCMRNISLVTETMKRIRAMGVSFAIDDFGTGYCSLQYLHRLPVDCLKVDQSFVRAMDDDHSGGDIVSAVISMAKAFGLSSIAEGVETYEQLERLRQRGCDNIQGYLVSRPLSYDDFSAYLRKG
jgi:diguanylate cyclase (GGDEF)-like protein/PAS domain S-box-containing protein